MYSITRISFILYLVLFLVACATNTIQPEEIKDIHSIKVLDNETELQISYSGPGQAWAAGLGGAIGGTIMQSSYSDEQKIIYNFIKENNIDIQSLIKQGVKEKLSQNKRYTILNDDSNTSDASFIIQEYSVGFHSSSPFSKNVRPTIGFRIQLVKSNGDEIWSGVGFSGIYSVPVEEGRNLSEWVEDKETAIQKINKSVDFAVNTFINFYAKAQEQ